MLCLFDRMNEDGDAKLRHADILIPSFFICSAIVNSKLGKVMVAVRDAESRTRFLGYDVANVKLFAFVVSAVIAGIAAWVSYWHMAGVAIKYGETGASPFLLPFSVDGLIVAASISMVEIGGRIRALTPVIEAAAAPSSVAVATPVQAPVPEAEPSPAGL